MSDSDEASPDVLVDTDWVAAHLNDPGVRLIEANEDPHLYGTGHIPGAVMFNWHSDMQGHIVRDFITREEFEDLVEPRGITNDTTVVFYGDCNNWYATYAYWLFKLYGHRDCRIMDGGRSKWEAEKRGLTRDMSVFPRSTYRAQPADLSIRAFRDQVLAHIYASWPLIDTRSPEEYSGTVVRPPKYPWESAQRAGHVPTARNVPWSTATNPDGTFKDVTEMREAYLNHGISPDLPVIVYSHAGERSAHTWFALSQLLGYPEVRNYDGSWTEWGNLVRAPIERDDGSGGHPGATSD